MEYQFRALTREAVIALGAFAGGFGLSVFNTLFETTVQKEVPPEALSRISSIVWMLSASLLPLGFAAAGWVMISPPS